MAEKDGFEGLRQELVGESARSLGLAAERLVAALAALQAYDDAGGSPDADARRELVDAAGERAWYYVIQRETLGFHDTEDALALYDVPREVRLRMGVIRETVSTEPS